MLRNVKTRRSHDGREARRLAEEIRRRIATGTYPPHSFLPAERPLSESLGTSRAAVRKAIELLEADRLVLKSQGRGVRVLPPLERLSHGLIGVLFPQGAFNLPDSAPVLQGIQQTLSRAGYAFDFAEISWRNDQPFTVMSDKPWTFTADGFQERYGAGIIWTFDSYNEHIVELERRRVPVVAPNLQHDLDVSCTRIDHEKASRCAVDMLVALGHRRIGFVGREPSRAFYGSAWKGYLSGIEAHGLPRDESLFAVCQGTSPLSGYLAVKPLLALPSPPTALIAARDLFAHGAWHAITEASLTVGRDISLIGFDDVSWPEEESFLTTFRMPCHALGALAAEMLIDRVVNGWRPPERRELDTPLVLRQSVGLAPGLNPPAAHRPGQALFSPLPGAEMREVEATTIQSAAPEASIPS